MMRIVRAELLLWQVDKRGVPCEAIRAGYQPKNLLGGSIQVKRAVN